MNLKNKIVELILNDKKLIFDKFNVKPDYAVINKKFNLKKFENSEVNIIFKKNNLEKVLVEVKSSSSDKCIQIFYQKQLPIYRDYFSNVDIYLVYFKGGELNEKNLVFEFQEI